MPTGSVYVQVHGSDISLRECPLFSVGVWDLRSSAYACAGNARVSSQQGFLVCVCWFVCLSVTV